MNIPNNIFEEMTKANEFYYDLSLAFEATIINIQRKLLMHYKKTESPDQTIQIVNEHLSNLKSTLTFAQKKYFSTVFEKEKAWQTIQEQQSSEEEIASALKDLNNAAKGYTIETVCLPQSFMLYYLSFNLSDFINDLKKINLNEFTPIVIEKINTFLNEYLNCNLETINQDSNSSTCKISHIKGEVVATKEFEDYIEQF